jgi:hypothetical protein
MKSNIRGIHNCDEKYYYFDKLFEKITNYIFDHCDDDCDFEIFIGLNNYMKEINSTALKKISLKQCLCR